MKNLLITKRKRNKLIKYLEEICICSYNVLLLYEPVIIFGVLLKIIAPEGEGIINTLVTTLMVLIINLALIGGILRLNE